MDECVPEFEVHVTLKTGVMMLKIDAKKWCYGGEESSQISSTIS